MKKQKKSKLSRIILILIVIIINIVLIIMVLSSIADVLKEREYNLENNIELKIDDIEQEDESEEIF